MIGRLLLIFLLVVAPCRLPGRELPVTLEELPATTGLPDPLTFNDGSPVRTMEDWERRREELIEPLLFYQYGRIPPRPDEVTARLEREEEFENGLGTQSHLTLTLGSQRKLTMRIVVYKPRTAGPHPVIIEEDGNPGNSRNAALFLARNYLFVEYARGDLAPDRRGAIGPARNAYPGYDWALLAVWAWGGMRVVDYLEQRKDVDHKRIGITGHSRGGKAVLLAGALDERITLVAPCQSGAGGAGCSRILGPGAESIGMNDKPNWYHERIRLFAENEAHLPFDQHFVKALVAPRGLFCNESTDDLFANPVGTHASSEAAMPVFKLFGKEGNNGLRYRRGGHSYDREDWEALLAFAEWTFYGRGQPVWQEPAVVEPRRNAPDAGFVPIGQEGNEGHPDYVRVGSFGAVAHRYRIARNKVSNLEYATFLNGAAKQDPHGLYHPKMRIRRTGQAGAYRYEPDPPQHASKAVTYVSWTDALRYCNWMHGGDPERGAYPFRADGSVGPRQPRARFHLPNDDEWVKAAWYHPETKSYRSGLLPTAVTRFSTDTVNSDPPKGHSPYGMLGAADPIWEWTETRVGSLFRGVRSDSWFQGNNKQARGRFYSNPNLELGNLGFRVARRP